MTFQILHIKLENFRCFENFETDLWKSTSIESDNEGGKSTIASAIIWCLTGKNIDGNSAFEIITAGKYGKESSSVELECEKDDKPLTLKREYKAKFARDKSFSEYVTTCYVNGIECGVRKFDKYISENVCDENIFKILSNPYTFVENCPKEGKELVWQAQRRLLMSLIADSDDIAIAESKEQFKPLVEPLSRYDNINQYITYLKQEISKATKSLTSFEDRLMQQEGNMVEVDISLEEAQQIITDTMQKIKELETKNTKHKANADTAKRTETKDEISRLNDKMDNLLEDYNAKMAELNHRKQELSIACSEKMSESKAYLAKQAQYASKVEEIQNSKTTTICETCKRPLPENMLKAFENNKAVRIAKGNAYVEKARSLAEQSLNEYNALAAKLNELKEPVYPLEVETIKETISSLVADLASCQEVSNLEGYEVEKAQLESELNDAQKTYYDIKYNEECEAKIVELEKENKKNNIALNNLTMQLDLCKDFTSYKCELNESKINALFPTVRFKLFEENKTNDDIKEVCNMTFNGHKYEDLSASTKLVANLELLNVFQKHYNAYVPIVIDNCESITADIDNAAQVIKMYVREELCPKCSGKSGRRNADGLWTCENCGNRWTKKIEIKEN